MSAHHPGRARSVQDGQLAAWTALGLIYAPSCKSEWAQYSWLALGWIDCSTMTLARPCGPGRSGTEWWCIEVDRYADVAHDWGTCQVPQSSSVRDRSHGALRPTDVEE